VSGNCDYVLMLHELRDVLICPFYWRFEEASRCEWRAAIGDDAALAGLALCVLLPPLCV